MDEELLGGAAASRSSPSRRRWPILISAIAIAAVLLLAGIKPDVAEEEPSNLVPASPISRGKSAGVSEKSSGALLGEPDLRFPWTNDMLLWQRTAFHFQPEKNWMNDPDGPLFYKGWYHLFYQYNPSSAVWGNISWGHAVSRDLVQWLHLPLAMVPDRWYDANGVWTGSATLLPDGRVAMLYTGSTNASVQVQNLAFPANSSDPLLLQWVKHDAANPVLFPPPGVSSLDFRDPTTAWFSPGDSSWRLAIGSKDRHRAGVALVYSTRDFLSFELLDGVLHAVPGTGMWECVDLYPVAVGGLDGLDGAANGDGVKHVLKASLDDDKHDYYAIGSYDLAANVWIPDDPSVDVGIGLRVDYGKYYASKTFFDQEKRRRLLWGWIGETDSECTDLLKGWASVQSIPRTVLLDQKTGKNLLQWPVEELETLRESASSFSRVEISPGSVLPLDVGIATQLDIVAEFEVGSVAPEAEPAYNCSTSGGAAGRGALGPFGLLVLADDGLSEQTAVYFYLARRPDGELATFICQDELRSSNANDIVKRVYGNSVPVLDGEKLSVRILVDHSIVETFAQGGRTCITSRVYPTQAIGGAARVFLFNNATSTAVTAVSVKIWQLRSAGIREYQPSDGI
ncbi:beta-fructofuranosidase 1-like [Wolffia australiana]